MVKVQCFQVPFTIHTDHQSLECLEKMRDANGGSLDGVYSFNPMISVCMQHRSGKTKDYADGLSRQNPTVFQRKREISGIDPDSLLPSIQEAVEAPRPGWSPEECHPVQLCVLYFITCCVLSFMIPSPL